MDGPLTIGVDPDCDTTAWAIADKKSVRAVGIIRGGLRELVVGLEAAVVNTALMRAVVEGQKIYPGSKVAPNDIVKLARFAGFSAGILAVTSLPVLIPMPFDWKGQATKDVNQGRTFSHYGILYEVRGGRDAYCVPSGCAKFAQIRGAAALNAGDWKHVGDAVGLALWGARQ